MSEKHIQRLHLMQKKYFTDVFKSNWVNSFLFCLNILKCLIHMETYQFTDKITLCTKQIKQNRFQMKTLYFDIIHNLNISL
jgi:hypothetical protein